jgi:hypothetical protein
MEYFNKAFGSYYWWKVVGEWGVRKWIQETLQNKTIQYPHLTDGIIKSIRWSRTRCWVTNYWILKRMKVKVLLKISSKWRTKNRSSGWADGIRSTVRRFIIGDEQSPLRYLGCIVILGICPLSVLRKWIVRYWIRLQYFKLPMAGTNLYYALQRRFSNVAIEFSNDWKRG